eukprot:CAMPEP_0171050378 /NCGR_PEP_ID=MMETSP0736-20130129/52355_1 /TAXON_ID=186038 /ORGANISM="Fragilariopsis kerguelensis, Strain L26-C5" /LENGTH=31 /DNA_ID= /DNA_START= /DNA_END= /DNA_ORIENTATION=
MLTTVTPSAVAAAAIEVSWDTAGLENRDDNF